MRNLKVNHYSIRISFSSSLGFMMHASKFLAFAVSITNFVTAVNFIPHDIASAKSVLKLGADNLMGFYNFAQIGVLPEPYWWWETGGAAGLVAGFGEFAAG